MSNDTITRFFGGQPLAVLFRLILLSILIGFILHAFNFDPWNIIQSIKDLIWRIWNLGYDAIDLVWRYFILGAVIVLPIWLVVRLINTPRGR
ncbi:MAG: DUF6460 domain-containing protein [Pseudorhodoplanes sp.]|nr:hypothetical protein [Pseudorhodoplanes sp.]MBW7948260.1 hypothetical protein [Pseudorhodoplanes sp.]MCL4709775.1 hypothetical protein [Pseudorhodoplanes sp.]MCZ7641932.1 DUF6460 domain-containing protein [Pseudorhodoplanes sp.]GIK79611.1 MAG: hypothetical protein BroJett024_07160 [Alphaproteobacteria bacterium]